VQAIATLRCILVKSANHMPHRSCTFTYGEKVVSKVLPATWKWKESISKLNIVNRAFELKEALLSNLNKIWKLNFHEYASKKHGDNFSSCSTCDRLHSLWKAAVLRSLA
jgi:hypothetical protein